MKKAYESFPTNIKLRFAESTAYIDMSFWTENAFRGEASIGFIGAPEKIIQGTTSGGNVLRDLLVFHTNEPLNETYNGLRVRVAPNDNPMESDNAS